MCCTRSALTPSGCPPSSTPSAPASTPPSPSGATRTSCAASCGGWGARSPGRPRPIEDLIAQFAAGERATPDGRRWRDLAVTEQRDIADSHRLAYLSQQVVNWCPGLGTVLADEEVTAEDRSAVGNFPVYRRPVRQWMLRITAYAERLLADLDQVDWPENVKRLQRNWIGPSG